jgi:hypothetical protein
MPFLATPRDQRSISSTPTPAVICGRRCHRRHQLSHTERADLPLPSVQIKGLRLPLVLLEHVVGAHTYALNWILSPVLIHGPDVN